MTGPEVAVVFPQLHRRGGIERVCWDLLEYLAPRHETAFVGTDAPDGTPAGVRWVGVAGRPDPGPWGLWTQRTRIDRAVQSLQPVTTVTMGSVVPPGDVLWVPSVHRAWLDAARRVQMGPVQVPARLRYLMPRHRVLLAMEAQYFRGGRPRRILCLSRQEVDALVHYYDVDPTVTTVVPNPFDPQQFNPERRTRDREAARAAMGIGEDEMAVLFIANELHRKGFGPLLGALSLSGEQRMAVHMVGKADIGPYRTMIHRLGLDGRVHVAGPSADVGWHLAAADLMVLPTQYEPFGLVIIEALASGVPVITSRLAGASEAIDHGSTGLILEDPYDVEELAALLVQAAAADLESWGRRAAASVDAYRRDRVMPRVESVIFP